LRIGSAEENEGISAIPCGFAESAGVGAREAEVSGESA